ncbi:MAG: HAD family phosphatase [Cyanobacteriota bacterium]|nr:HAD family phosphatase [Cyanobacteriota bacterium]
MSLKAVLFDFNGIIINDEPVHEKLTEQLLIEENLLVKPGEFRQFCLGRSDRACLKDILKERGRYVAEGYIDQLIQRKAEAYLRELEALEEFPIYADTRELILKMGQSYFKMAVVTGAVRSEVEMVLARAGLDRYFSAIVAGDEMKRSKPEPDGYLLAVERLNQLDPELNLRPEECLAIEDSFAGIEAAKRAGIPVVGVAHTYPFHMLQRLASWCVDYLSELEWERIKQVYEESALPSA